MIIKLKELKAVNGLDWTNEQLDMKEEIISNYDPKKGIIKISKDNKILDGNHRYFILIRHYGGEYEIEVDKKRFNRSFYLIRFWVLFLLTFPFLIIWKLVKKCRWPR